MSNAATAWTNGYAGGEEITVPFKNGEGRFIADEATLDELEGEGRVVVRYVGGAPERLRSRHRRRSPTPSGNVVGLMPHPEHAIDPLTGPVGRRARLLSRRIGGHVRPRAGRSRA